ncbi:hypothetical protein [Paraburkholderia fungorum]|uniref:hypothetical protein n=1 Tax=Paraburkholderia fungorum TaxID=134537 RepID=UPI0038783272
MTDEQILEIADRMSIGSREYYKFGNKRMVMFARALLSATQPAAVDREAVAPTDEDVRRVFALAGANRWHTSDPILAREVVRAAGIAAPLDKDASKPAAPEGWKLVPNKVTPRMVAAYHNYWRTTQNIYGLWVALLDASPVIPSEEPAAFTVPERRVGETFSEWATRTYESQPAAAPAQSGEPVGFRSRVPGFQWTSWITDDQNTIQKAIKDAHDHGIECEALYAAPPAQTVQSEAVLDKPAKVAGGRFGVGVKWSTVIGAAQRHYEYEVTPEKEAARIARAGEVIKSIQRGEYLSEPAQTERALTDDARDAARYRWLRSHAYTDDFIIFSYSDGVSAFALRGSEADHRIDAALTAAQSASGDAK